MSHRQDHQLGIDPIACKAHGLCAELLPELIELDEWGYPLVRELRIGRGMLPEARAVVAACPTLALRLSEKPG